MIDMPMTRNDTIHEVAILVKASEFAVIAYSLYKPNGNGLLGRNDPRDAAGRHIANSMQIGEEAGQRNFENSIKHSQDNGWRIAWRGFPYGR